MYPPPSWRPPGVKSGKKTGGHSAVMATTRAATFSAKIRTLSDFHTRIINQQQPPSSAEIVTTLRYFQQTLVGFLKEIPSERSILFEQYSTELATIRSSLYPNLNYSGLFYGIVNLLDAFPMLVTAQTAIAEAILDTLKALYFFLDRDCIDQMPLLLASLLGVFPSEMDRRLVHLLCDCILPYSFGEGANGRVSVPAVLILILHHSADPSLHTMAFERLACRLPDIYNDLLTVIASGTGESRIAAANLLFHYWPLMNPAILHRRSVQYRIHGWSLPHCQSVHCAEKGLSNRFTYEPALCGNLGDSAPPIFLCNGCADSAQAEMPIRFLCHPLPNAISATCQNKGCGSSSRIAVGTCFDEDCIRSNGYLPLRLCQECFVALHPPETRATEHIRHSGQSQIWSIYPLENIMVEAVVKLLRETSAQLTELSSEGEAAKRPKWLRQLEAGRELGREVDQLSDERRMLSRFGIWLMAAHCPPVMEATSNSIGYLLSALFQWFATTALLPNDAMGQTLEQLKSDFACEWLNQALANHYEVFVNELLPQQLEPIIPGDEAIWDLRAVRREQMRDGLGKLLALAPYDVITLATWSRVMPHWLHALNTDLMNEEELLDLKVPLSKLFEPDLCPLPFEAHRLFEFLATRLQADSYAEVLKALDWLHLLTRIDIRISLELLLEMFSNSLCKLPVPESANAGSEQTMKQFDSKEADAEAVEDGIPIDGDELVSSPGQEHPPKQSVEQQPMPMGPLAAQLIMTDILAQQIKLAGGSTALSSSLLERLFSVITALLHYQSEEQFIQQGWVHSCKEPDGDQFADCLRCQQALFLYQVLLQVIEQFCPKEESKLDSLIFGDDADKEFADWLSEASSSQHQQQSNSPRPSPSPRALSTSSPAGAAFFASPVARRRQQKTSTPLAKARQELSTPGGEMVGALPTEEVETARAQAAMSIAEQSPMGLACVSATVVGVAQEGVPPGSEPAVTVTTAEARKDSQQGPRVFWETSVGRFRFSMEQMPAQLRLTYVLLANVEREPDPDVQFFLLSLLKYLFLHRECLSNARREQEHRGFLVWLQENLLIPRLWTLLRSDFSHVGQMAVPLVLHAITLPLGDDVFWETVNQEFTSTEWEHRLKAVDRVLVLAHFVPPTAVRTNRTLQTALSCAFSHLIVSAHDPNPAVAQKALLALEALPHNSLMLICQCLEAQFDSCILDRPLIISRIHLLTLLLPEESLLSWDFFIQRFESLALEAQLKAQQNAGTDTSSMHFVQDLLHSDPMSDLYQRKVTRARQSLNEADSVRSIVRSLRESSLRHQLNPGVKGDQARRDMAKQLLRVRHRRGAVFGTEQGSSSTRELARLRLRKVLVVVRVVSAWRDLAGRLLLPQSRRSSRLSQRSAASGTAAALAEAEDLLQHHQGKGIFELAEQEMMDEQGLLLNMEQRRSLQSTPPLLLPTLPQQQHQSRGGSACSLALEPGHPQIHATLSNVSLSPSNMGDARYGRMREFTDEESNLCLLLNRVVDMQNPERHTVFLVVSLFVRFLASKRCGPAENAKKQSVLLRHFNTLLGYSNSDKCFTIPPARLRRAAVCNAFLHGLAEVLDSNLLIGNQLLAIVLQLLLYLPSPQKFASDAPSADYSLRLLSAQQRHNWLHALITILYKYRCDTPPTSESIRKLMLIVVQTLEQQCHKCPHSNQSDQQQTGPVPPEKKERRSAVGLLDAPIMGGGGGGAWSSSDSEGGSGDEEDTQKERLPPMHEEVEEHEAADKERKKSAGITLQRPESLKILAIKEGSRERKESTKTIAKGIDVGFETVEARPPSIALHPPPIGSQRQRQRSSGSGQTHQITGLHAQAQPRPSSTLMNAKQLRQPSESTKLSCGNCGMRLEFFDEETLSLCCVALCTFLHRTTSLAAPLLPRTLRCIARFIETSHFPWHETNVFVPGNARSAAKQLIRIILHQLSSSGIALQLFNLQIQADELHPFWSRIAHALADFTELNPVLFLQNLLEDVSEGWPMRATRILHNLAIYLQYMPTEAISNWTAVISQLDALYRRLHTQLSTEPISLSVAQSQVQQSLQQRQLRAELTSSVLVISRVLRVQSFATIKGAVQLVEAFAKWMVEILHKCPVDLWDLLTVCTACNRGMIRERDKQILTRGVVSELVAALKFKCELVESNYLTIVRMVLQDFGEPLVDDWAAASGGGAYEQQGEDSESRKEPNTLAFMPNDAISGMPFESQQSFGGAGDQFNTGAAEAIRPHVPELLEFIADMHVLAKLKKQSASNSDRVGGDLKAGLAEIIALEMSRPSVRDSRTVMRFIPWLYSPPSLAQALPGQFAESVANVRVLSWILLGALHARGSNGLGTNGQQMLTAGGMPLNCCLPVPIACTSQMADYIHFVLAGFADQSKQSVVHMSALFHAFHLCQLWTIYCEQTAAASRSEDTLARTMQQILDFWARVTPAILQLLSHSKVLADMVNLHFVNTLQALQQVNSAVLCQLYPMWEPVLTAYHAHVPRQLRLKLDAVEAQPPLENPQMKPWLSKVRYKISQIELQTSAASPFYNV